MSENFDVNGKVTIKDDGATTTLDKVGESAKKSGQATKDAGEAAKATGTNVGQMASAFGVAGQAVGKLSPAMGQLTTMTGGALSMVQSLTTAGMGPLGIAVAGVSLAVTAGSAIMAAFESDVADAAAEVHQLRTATLDAAAAFDAMEQAQARQQATAQRGAQLALGQATAAQADIELRRLNLELDALNSTNFRGENDRQIRRLEDRLQMVTEGADAARAAADADARTASQALAAGHGGKGAETGSRGGGGGGARDTSAADAARLVADADAQREEQAAARLARLTEDMEAEADVRRLMREQEIAESNAAKDQAIEIEQQRVEGVQAALDEEAAAREKTQALISDIQGATMAGMGIVTAAVDASLEGSKKSEEEQAKIKAKAALVTSIIGAALETAQSVASFASLNIPQGIAHAGAAVMYGISAAKAAAVAGGSAGSAPSAPSASAPGGGPSAAGPAGGKGGDVININWGSSALVYAADRDALGRDIDDMVTSARARRA